MLRRTTDDQAAITRTWSEVEAAVGSLQGRRFYGVFDVGANEYRVCVEWRDGDDAHVLGLEEGSLPGGRYARERLRGQPPALYQSIKPAFERLAQRHDRGPSRPELEFYRSHGVIDLLYPVAAGDRAARRTESTGTPRG